jgi:hypothetical protein
LNALCPEVFGFKTKSVEKFLEILTDGKARTKKRIYRKLAQSYLLSNFQGDDSDCEFLGKLFAVRIGIFYAEAISRETKRKKSRVQNFSVNFVVRGWDTMSSEEQLYSENKEMQHKRYLKLTFWLARVGSTNYDTRKETNREPKDQLKLLHNSKYSSRIDEFLTLSHGYEQPIIIDKGTDLYSVIYDTDGKFVLDKPIVFTNNAFSLTGMRIDEPFASRLSLLDNLQHIIDSQKSTSNYATVIEIHEQKEYHNKYTWDDLQSLFQAQP